jgi:GTP-sensing pleiotropic transcriptional regulator CodY
LFNKSVIQSSVEVVKTSTEVVKTSTELVKYKVTENEKKEIWNKFIADTKIPHRVTTSTGTYTVRQFSLPAANCLLKIVKDPAIDYNRLVKSTNNYYNTVTYKILLSKYLLNGVWKDEYEHYKESIETSGGNRFED